MIESIHLHLSEDEAVQVEHETALSVTIHDTFRRNVTAFKRFMPMLANQAQNISGGSYSLFSNKFGETNLVDYGEGRAMYGLHPVQECKEQVAAFCQHPLYIDLQAPPNNQSVLEALANTGPISEHIPVLVVLGLGLGYHVLSLIETLNIDHLIIYEPEKPFFRCSVMACDWLQILNKANQKKTAIYMQLGNNGGSLASDITELRQNIDVDGFYLYKHYNNGHFDHIVSQLCAKGWQSFTNWSGSHQQEKYDQFIPMWTGSQRVDEWLSLEQSQRYNANLEAFKKYVPDVYTSFKDYEPLTWQPVQDNGSINVVHKKHGVSWYAGVPAEISQIQFEGFCRHPRKDGVVLGYNGKKLKHYLHYQFVQACEEIVESLTDEQRSLPEHVRSLIVFGLGSGYGLANLMAERQIDKLFICEPNRDFFYASLYAIDWATILQKVDDSGSRIYFNIGDDGSHLFLDLLNQFHSIGPYVLAETYFYQGYYNALLNNAIAQLREQLQVVIAMGEHFDHAYYGISHTLSSIKNGHRFLTSQKQKSLRPEQRDVPVFLIGNGPSIDEAIELIKESREQAILVSCGTALQVLHRHGIKPDFHAEIEQNRSTFDWAKSILDDDFLADIDLLSCNGFHPDTSKLYRNIYLAFKEGESSSVSAMDVLGDDFEVLTHAFPTVCNFAANLFMALGFHQLYLLGVDMGFKDKSKHHSKSSGYYTEDGEEVYDYADGNNVSIRVPGNFADTVYTKYEFKVATTSLERALSEYNVECYNTADGAKIHGTSALHTDMVLLSSSSDAKSAALKSLRETAFVKLDADTFFADYKKKYSHDRLLHEVSVLKNAMGKKFNTTSDVETLVELQKMALFESYKGGNSLLFYYLYGSLNYYQAVLTKILGTGLEDDTCVERCNEVRTLWLETFDSIEKKLKLSESEFDVSHSMAMRRFYHCMKHDLNGVNLHVVSNSRSFTAALRNIIDNTQLNISLTVETVSQFQTHFNVTANAQLVVYINPEFGDADFPFCDALHQSVSKPLIIVNEFKSVEELEPYFPTSCIMLVPGDCFKNIDSLQSNDYYRARTTLEYVKKVSLLCLILPKLKVPKESLERFGVAVSQSTQTLIGYDFQEAIGFSYHHLSNDQLTVASGFRGYCVGTSKEIDSVEAYAEPIEMLYKLRKNIIKNHPYLVCADKTEEPL